MSRPASSSPFELFLRLPGLLRGALQGRSSKKARRASIAEATGALQQATLPFVFCFGGRHIIPSRPCDECDAETELFVVTTETDRRLAVSRLAAEGDRT